MSKAAAAAIRIGVGGWTYEPWRDNFFPAGLPHSRELEYASRRLTAIEINGTYYRTQSPKSFAKWRDETPPGFVFSVKATRYATNQRVLADAGDSVRRFVESGLKWAHLDIAGTAWSDKAGTLHDKGATGFGVALLDRFVADNFEG